MDKNLNQALSKASEVYADKIALRALVQLIPHVGGPIDTLFAGKGIKLQNARLEHLIQELQQQFSSLQTLPIYDEEELLDLVIRAMECTVKTRAKEKRAAYAAIIAKHVADSKNIEESEIALRIVSELDLIHLNILHQALSVSLSEAPFEGLRAFSISNKSPDGGDKKQLPSLQQVLPQYSINMLRSACSELLSKGLLHDEGIGRWDMGAMEIFIPTENADWLQSWLVRSKL